jgi:hypothetical protein
MVAREIREDRRRGRALVDKLEATPSAERRYPAPLLPSFQSTYARMEQLEAATANALVRLRR